MTEPSKSDIAAADDAFSHGGSYPETNGKVRPEPCPSCAFVTSPETVRPEGLSISALERASADYDDFLCHCFDAEGKSYSCAGWAARFGQSSSEVRGKAKAW